MKRQKIIAIIALSAFLASNFEFLSNSPVTKEMLNTCHDMKPSSPIPVINTTSFILTNSYKNDTRVWSLSMSAYSFPGYTITGIDLSVDSNAILAQNDWKKIETSSLATSEIDKNGSGTLIEAVAQEIIESCRYQINNVSTRIAAHTDVPGDVPAPELQLWDSNGGLPNAYYFSADLTKNTAYSWINTTTNYIINATNPTNNSWYVAINGTNWGDDVDNNDLTDYVKWTGKSVVGSPAGYGKDWGTPGFYAINKRYDLIYNRLYLEDSDDTNRSFDSDDVNLIASDEIGNTSFDGSGFATGLNVTDTSILEIYADSCVAGDITMTIYYVLEPWDHASPFTIVSNADYPTYASSGSGTDIDPWIIENFTIDAGGITYGGLIMNSNEHCIVQNGIINNTGTDSTHCGIALMGGNNVDVRNITIYNIGNTGIGILGVHDITIDDCIIYNDNDSCYVNTIGIYMDGVETASVFNTRIENMTLNSIWITDMFITPCLDVLFENISLVASGIPDGINMLNNHTNIRFTNVVSTGMDTDILMDGDEGSTFFDNITTSSSDYDSIDILDSSNVIIENSHFNQTGMDIWAEFDGCNNITIDDCVFTNGTILIYYSDNVLIQNCNITIPEEIELDNVTNSIVTGCIVTIDDNLGTDILVSDLTNVNITYNIFINMINVTGYSNTNGLLMLHNAYDNYFDLYPSVSKAGRHTGDILPITYSPTNDAEPIYSEFIWGYINLSPVASFYVRANMHQIYAKFKYAVIFDGSEGDVPATFEWHFSDTLLNYSGPTVFHTFKNVGTYSITLTVIDYTGDTSTISMSIIVRAAPGNGGGGGGGGGGGEITPYSIGLEGAMWIGLSVGTIAILSIFVMWRRGMIGGKGSRGRSRSRGSMQRGSQRRRR